MNSSKRLSANMEDIQKAVQDVLEKKGIHDLHVTHISLHNSALTAAADCAGHWEWKCEQTSAGYVCHWVCMP